MISLGCVVPHIMFSGFFRWYCRDWLVWVTGVHETLKGFTFLPHFISTVRAHSADWLRPKQGGDFQHNFGSTLFLWHARVPSAWDPQSPRTRPRGGLVVAGSSLVWDAHGTAPVLLQRQVRRVAPIKPTLSPSCSTWLPPTPYYMFSAQFFAYNQFSNIFRIFEKYKT